MKVLKLFIGLHLAGMVAFVSRMFAHGTADEVAAKWAQNISNAQTSMQAGVQRVTVAPGVTAAQNVQKFQNKMQDPATFQKWARNVQSVSLTSWQQSMLNIGIQRAAQGASQKQAKFSAAMNALLPFIDNLRNTVRNMPSATTADREQRMLAWSRGMATYQKPTSGV